MQYDAVVPGFDLRKFFVVSNDHALVSEMVAEGVGDLCVEKREQAVPGVDQVHFYIEITENGCV